MYGPHVAMLLMGASRKTRRVDFRELTGSQRTPGIWGVTKLAAGGTVLAGCTVTPRPNEVHITCNCRDTYVHQVPL